MADFAGLLDVAVLTDSTYSRTAPRFRHAGEFASLLALVVPMLAGTLAATGTTPAATNPNYAGVLGSSMTAGFDWFEKVHLLPRTPINFGNIITTVTAPFELFNAYRTSTVLIAFTNNVGEGVDIPDLPGIPHTLYPFTSILGPTSTRLAPVRMNVVASSSGAARFDGTLDFTFSPGGTLMLHVLGNRIVLLPFEFDGEPEETLQFLTDAMVSVNGKAQRVSPRKQPRAIFDVELIIDGLDRRVLDMLLFGWLTRAFGLPMWHEAVQTTVAILVNTSPTVTVKTTVGIDFRVGGFGLVFSGDVRVFDVLTIASVGATSVTFESNVQNAYAVGAEVVPLRVAEITGQPSARVSPVNVQKLRARFRVTDNDTGAPTGSTAAFSSYLGKVLLDDPNFLDGNEMGETYTQDVTIIDNDTGRVEQSSIWDRSKRHRARGFRARTRQAVMDVRRLVLALRGSQVSFWIPTFNDDLTPAASLVVSTNTIDVDNVGYAQLAVQRHPKKTFRITFTDGTSLVRTITASAEISATVERLTLDATWPANRTAAEVVRIMFYELCILGSDEVRIRHLGIGRASVDVPIEVAFDQ